LWSRIYIYVYSSLIWGKMNRNYTCLTLFFCVILLVLSESSEAGIVYGRVTCDSCKTSGITLSLTNSNNGKSYSVRTDGNSYYRISLPQGRYEVFAFIDRKPFEAKIKSSANPVRQDIYLYPGK